MAMAPPRPLKIPLIKTIVDYNVNCFVNP
jgi:hypothetical protein